METAVAIINDPKIQWEWGSWRVSWRIWPQAEASKAGVIIYESTGSEGIAGLCFVAEMDQMQIAQLLLVPSFSTRLGRNTPGPVPADQAVPAPGLRQGRDTQSWPMFEHCFIAFEPFCKEKQPPAWSAGCRALAEELCCSVAWHTVLYHHPSAWLLGSTWFQTCIFPSQNSTQHCAGLSVSAFLSLLVSQYLAKGETAGGGIARDNRMASSVFFSFVI